MEKKEIVFLDRDGTINVDLGYVTQPDKVLLLDGAAQAIGDLVRSGFSVVVVSNQSAIGRGFATWSEVNETNKRLEELLLQVDSDAHLELIVCSPHAPWDVSETRKPKTGLVEEVRKHLDFDAASCWVVGDKESDMQFGLNLGAPPAQCIWLKEQSATVPDSGVRVVSTLKEAASIILRYKSGS